MRWSVVRQNIIPVLGTEKKSGTDPCRTQWYFQRMVPSETQLEALSS